MRIIKNIFKPKSSIATAFVLISLFIAPEAESKVLAGKVKKDDSLVLHKISVNKYFNLIYQPKKVSGYLNQWVLDSKLESLPKVSEKTDDKNIANQEKDSPKTASQDVVSQENISQENISQENISQENISQETVYQEKGDSKNSNLRKSVVGYSWNYLHDSKKQKSIETFLSKQKGFFVKYDSLLGSKSFARGMLENEQKLNQWNTIFQLYIIRMQYWIWTEEWKKYFEMEQKWFLFLSDFVYEDSGLISIKTVSLFRSMLLDQMESLIYSQALDVSEGGAKALPRKKQSINQKIMIHPDFEKARRAFLGVSAPWPVDRMVLTEGRKLPLNMQKVIDKLVSQIQKNPYQGLKKTLNEMGYNQESSAWMAFANFWKTSDIDTLQTEINRIGKLALFWTFWHYAKSEKKEWKELVESLQLSSATKLRAEEAAIGNNVMQKSDEVINWDQMEKKLTEKNFWLAKIPIDYKTGRPMRLLDVIDEVLSLVK